MHPEKPDELETIPGKSSYTVNRFKSHLIALFAEASQFSTRDQLAVYIFAYDLVETALTRPPVNSVPEATLEGRKELDAWCVKNFGTSFTGDWESGQ
jgi:hypothetical protein